MQNVGNSERDWKVCKRSNEVIPFDRSRIFNAVLKASIEAMLDRKEAEDLATNAVNHIVSHIEEHPVVHHVDNINLLVEYYLQDTNPKVFHVFNYYRTHRHFTRGARKEMGSKLSDEFLSQFKHIHRPPSMTTLGEVVFYRTYSRWIGEELRYEEWWETCRRAVEYSCSIVPTTVEEAQKLFSNMFHLKQFLSGRTLFTGGTEVSKKFPLANYNCAFKVIDSIDSFAQVMYLLMLGSGVGVRVLYDDVKQLPSFRNDVAVHHVPYWYSKEKVEHTEMHFTKDGKHATITIGDSKEAWVKSLLYYLTLLTEFTYRDVQSITINYDHVRPKGMPLKTFGGTASGHEPLVVMFTAIDNLLKNRAVSSQRTKMSPIDALDLCNLIGCNVVVGGVRRTAELGLIDENDQECFTAKNNLYVVDERGNWIVNTDIIHRQMSNNSVFYTTKPSYERFSEHFDIMLHSGEPAWVNAVAGLKRNPKFQGVNPCAEILLDDKGLCNLTTLNILAFVEKGVLNVADLLEAQRLSARASLRVASLELELHDWDVKQKENNYLGCSLTGWQDMVNATGMSKTEQIKLLTTLRKVAKEEAEAYAKELCVTPPTLVTTVKPEGTLSQLPTVSSGLHYSHSPYYIRRVRMNSKDNILKACQKLGYPNYPEVGQTEENCTTRVVEFPVKSPIGDTKYDVTAVEQLEIYKMFMEHYVDHNASITVHMRPEEVDDVKKWLYNNWESTVAVSFLMLDDSFYQLMPYEACTEEEYNKRLKEMKPFSSYILSQVATHYVEAEIESSCENGICPSR